MSFSFRPSALPFHPKKLAAAVALAIALSEASVAQAAGLGNLTVRSALGQPLHAEIELVQTTSQDEGTLVPRLAGQDAFRQANIEFNPVLSSLRFAIEKRGDRRMIRITSSQPINEPFVDMLLELRGPDGRLMREYVFLLDPPAMAQSAPGMQVTGAAVPGAEDTAADAASSVASATSAASAASATSGRQQPSGRLARPAAASLPDPVQSLQNPPPARNPAASEQNSGRKPAAQAAATKPRLSLTDVSVAPGASPVFTAEENAAMEKAVSEANARVKALEQKVEALQQLLAATNGLLTEMHKQSGNAGKPALPGGAPGSITTAAATSDPVPRSAAPAATAAAADSIKPGDLPLKTSVSMTTPKPPAGAMPTPPSLMSDMLFPSLAGGSALVLGGIAAVLLRRRRKDAAAGATDLGTMGTTGTGTNSLAPLTESGNSMFMPTFGDSAHQTLSTNDPIAEADVYIAYGRDMQAEELLKEALRSRADSTAIRLKLLSIYASRNDKGNYCVLAAELYEMTRGDGDEWQQAVAMGMMIDPLNPLYSMTEKSHKAVNADGLQEQRPAASADTHVMEFESASTATSGAVSSGGSGNLKPAAVAAGPAADALMDLDFASSTQPLPSSPAVRMEDIKPEPEPQKTETETKTGAAPAPGTGPIDFDFDPVTPSLAAPPVEFDARDVPALPAISLPGTPEAFPAASMSVPAATSASSAAAPAIGPIDFDFQLPEIPAVPGHSEARKEDELPKLVAVEQPMTSLELDDFLADLTAPGKKDQK
jgi:pilus assembly protein FimV